MEHKVKIKMIDLFSGCGGLTDGFLQTDRYESVASVEWLLPQVITLRNRLKNKYNYINVDESVMRFDIQREDELFKGWQCDAVFGDGKGLDYYIQKSNGIDLIIGGPPCQAYSLAGRIRDKNGMRHDYRNYLFEHYLNVVNRYAPKIFFFENVPGIMSAAPDGEPIIQKIRKGFNEIGYDIIQDIKIAKINAVDYGVPQNRERMMIIGINNKLYTETQKKLNYFYSEILPAFKTKDICSVYKAISDLPKCLPYTEEDAHPKRISHYTPESQVTWHIPRYVNKRDMHTYHILEEDLASGKCFYDSKKISKLYHEKIGSLSPIHRYHVLDPKEPSTTIIAHLHKDGHRYIHYDPEQQRSITVREAARLQSFPDDFEFIGTRGDAYQMIGNAVPPLLAKNIASAIIIFMDYLKMQI